MSDATDGITQDWKVKDVREGRTEFTDYGQMKKFYVDFEGADGTPKDDTYWRRKMPATVDVGETYFGTISRGQYGLIFKKTTPQQHDGSGGTTSAGSVNTGTREWKPESERDPERSARILRQHSQEMAVRVLTAMGSFTTKDGGTIHRVLKSWTDWFDEDVNKVGRAAVQGGGVGGSLPSGSATASPPEQQPAKDTQADLEHALDTAGLTDAKSRLMVANYMIDNLPEDRMWKAVKNLVGSDLEAQSATLRALRAATETAYGEPLPVESAEPLDDIPF